MIVGKEKLIEVVDNLFYSGYNNEIFTGDSGVLFGYGISEMDSADITFVKHTFNRGINELLEDMQTEDKPELPGMKNLDEAMEYLMKADK